MTKKKRIILLFACLFLLIFIGSTSYTYAKYFSQEKQNIKTNIKKWNIKINDTDVKNGKNLHELVQTKIIKSEHIADNTIAPTSEGYFEINLDYTGTEVSFKYEIKMEENINIPDIEIYKIEVDDNVILTNGLVIENIINPGDDEIKKKNIKVYIRWNDDQNNGAIMNNENDTNATINYRTTAFDVSVNFTQVQ